MIRAALAGLTVALLVSACAPGIPHADQCRVAPATGCPTPTPRP